MSHNFKRSNFSQISNLLISCGKALSLSEFRILCYVISNVESWEYSDKRIAEAVGCHHNTVSKDINSLEVKGLLTVVQRGDRYGKKTMLRFGGEAAVQSFIEGLVQMEPRPKAKPGTNGAQAPGTNGAHKEDYNLKKTDLLSKNKNVCSLLKDVKDINDNRAGEQASTDWMDDALSGLQTFLDRAKEPAQVDQASSHADACSTDETGLRTFLDQAKEPAQASSHAGACSTGQQSEPAQRIDTPMIDNSANSDDKYEKRPTPMRNYDRLLGVISSDEILRYHYGMFGKPIEERMTQEQADFRNKVMGFSAKSVNEMSAAKAYEVATGLEDLSEYELKWFDRFNKLWRFGCVNGQAPTAMQRVRFLVGFADAKINQPTLSASIFLERILDPYAEEKREEAKRTTVRPDWADESEFEAQMNKSFFV